MLGLIRERLNFRGIRWLRSLGREVLIMVRRARTGRMLQAFGADVEECKGRLWRDVGEIPRDAAGQIQARDHFRGWDRLRGGDRTPRIIRDNRITHPDVPERTIRT